jgi:hypothetical protein
LLLYSPFVESKYFFFSDDDGSKEDVAVVLPPSASMVVEKSLQKEIATDIPPDNTLEKILTAPKRRKKATPSVAVSLDAHQTVSSLSDVSTHYPLL